MYVRCEAVTATSTIGLVAIDGATIAPYCWYNDHSSKPLSLQHPPACLGTPFGWQCCSCGTKMSSIHWPHGYCALCGHPRCGECQRISIERNDTTIETAALEGLVVATFYRYDEHNSDPLSLQHPPAYLGAPLGWQCCSCQGSGIMAFRHTNCLSCGHARCAYCSTLSTGRIDTTVEMVAIDIVVAAPFSWFEGPSSDALRLLHSPACLLFPSASDAATVKVV